ncbi:MAG: hypothetical protein IT186_12725 [Acidobacteria bacterium]|nr:hypothetical protein [Acidobacteriota bacterium]
MSEKAKLGKKLQVRGVLRELLRAELLDPENRKLIRQRLQAELRDAKSDLTLFRAMLSAGLEPEAALKPLPGAGGDIKVNILTAMQPLPGAEVTGEVVVRPAVPEAVDGSEDAPEAAALPEATPEPPAPAPVPVPARTPCPWDEKPAARGVLLWKTVV